jgi:predicted enzyme related to lactoylglutathione lyase
MGDRIDGGIVQCGASPAQWVPYVSVENLDASSERAAELGADVLLAPREGPYGWRSVVNSPVGGMMGLWQPKSNPWNQSNPWKRRGLK